MVLADLNADFPVPIAIVQHLDASRSSQLPGILARRTALAVKEAAEGDALSSGCVYIAPPGHHLVIGAPGIVSLTDTDRVHFVRPSADLLFESAALHCAPAIAVVLTGTGVDGSAGLASIKRTGGVAIAQAHAAFEGMPRAAIETGLIDFILPLEDIGSRLNALTR